MQNGDGSVHVKIENPENNAIEIKEFHKDAQNNVIDRLLKEMEELREKYNNNFYDLQNFKEQLQSASSARNLYQKIRIIDRIVIASLTSNNDTLQNQCKCARKLIEIIQTEYASTEKELLIAKKKIKELEGEICMASTKSKTQRKQNDERNIFEVERLVGHKNVNKVRHFRVRWKGFSSKDDTWEKEDNLNCSHILQIYKTENKLKK